MGIYAAPVLIDMAEALASDPEALNGLSMDRTSASIKMRHAFAPSFSSRTIEMMKKQAFSLNMDESASSNSVRVLTVLVSIYDATIQKVFVQHLSSFYLVHVDTSSIFNTLVNFFKENNIPWTNCLSILMDSCAVMRGSKSGLENKNPR